MGTKKKQVGSKKSVGSTSVPLVSLSADEMRRMLKPHTGFAAFAPEVIALYDAKKDTLGISGLDGAAITEALEKFTTLRDREIAAVEQLALIQGSRFYYSSTAYSMLLEMYARLQRASRTNPAIKRALAAFTEFMKHNASRKSGDEAVTPTATNGTTASHTMPASTTTPGNGPSGGSTS